MRARTVIEIRVLRCDPSQSELHIVTDDGHQLARRSMRSGDATIEHAAQCLASHYGLTAQGDGMWRSPERRHSSADEINPAA